MQRLHKELSEIGAKVEVPDVDPRHLDGIRRLRLLHANASRTKSASHEKTKTIGKPKPAPTPKPKGSRSLKAKQLTIGKAFVVMDGLFGLSIEATVGIFVGAAVVLILLGYLVYKYATWRPKMVARKGYRAVSKSKGIAVSESDGGTESGPRPAIIVAGLR